MGIKAASAAEEAKARRCAGDAAKCVEMKIAIWKHGGGLLPMIFRFSTSLTILGSFLLPTCAASYAAGRRP